MVICRGHLLTDIAVRIPIHINITHDVSCKPVEGAAGLSLNSTDSAPAPAPQGLDLDLESSPGEINTNLTLHLFIFPSSPSYAPMSTE